MKLDVLRKTKGSRYLGMAIGGVLLLWLVSWLALPSLLKSQLETRLSDQLGRQVTVGHVDFKPWSLELALNDFAIAHADVTNLTAQFAIKRLYIDMEAQSLFRLAPVVDAIQIDAPRLQLKHLGDGHYDIDDVLARLNQPKHEPTGKPLGFALYNVELAQGEVSLDDAAVGKVHKLTGLTIKLPFLSNLDATRHVQVQPQLAFALNGSPFDSSGQSTPFADSRKTEVNFKLNNLDLTPYLAYQPASLPVRLTSAVLNADLKLAFEQTGQTSVVVSGLVSASQVKLVAPGKKAGPAQDLIAFDALRVQLTDVRPLERKVQLGRVDWLKPQIALQRNAQGVLNWQALFVATTPAKNTSENIAAAEASQRAAGQKDKNSSPWAVAVAQVSMQGGELNWTDQTTPLPAHLTLRALEVSAQALQWPVTQSVPFEGSAKLDTAALSFKGSATDQAANATATVTDAPLNLAAPYLADVLVPGLNGLLNAELGLTWQAALTPKEPMQLMVQVPSLTLDKLELALVAAKTTKPTGRAPLASIRQVQLAQTTFDLTGQSVTLGQVRVTQPKTKLARLADGRWMFDDWLKTSPKIGQETDLGLAKVVVKGAPAQPAKPWRMAINDLSVTGGAFNYTDAAVPKPVAFDMSAVSLQLKNFSTQGSKPFSWRLGARMHHGQTEPGNLSGRGTVVLSPLAVQGDLDAQRLPVHALEPYMAGALNIELLRADASFKGRFDYAQKPDGMALHVRGDTRLEDFRADTLAQAEPFKPAEELLSWKDLSLTGLDVTLAPGAAARVDVAQTVLSDFYARLTLSEAGRLNLQDVQAVSVDPSPPSAPVVSSHETTKLIAVGAMDTGDTSQKSIQISSQSSAAPVIHFGPVTVTGGRVDFTDRFIKPNYSARLSELVGKLSAFSSQTANGEVQLADLELRGRAEGTATLEILGKVNPLAKPLALDIQGHVRDLELAPLSPYAVRYSGYGIERGKLSVDVAYKVQPDGQLTASNNIVLNQLKFGDQVPGAANSLPVKLAVALLADRNGVIDINLPVSGSLNDPQFRLAPIVFKLIVNLIAKAITAPFSLLVSAFGGGGDELSMVSFAPGSATLSAEARGGLDKVAKALLARPALKMTVVGTASLEVERDAFKREQLQALLLAEKRRAQPDAPSSAGPAVAASAAAGAISGGDNPVWLKAVYKRADFPKPRNLIGMAKDLPAPEMEALLLANLSATESAMQELAVRRGVVVRDYLSSLKLPLERLFLGAAKAVPPEAKWQPRAELNLATE